MGTYPSPNARNTSHDGLWTPEQARPQKRNLRWSLRFAPAYHRAHHRPEGWLVSTTLRGARLDEPEMPTGQIVLQAPPEIEQRRGRQRRADERHPDARQPRLDRAGGHDGLAHRRPQLHRGGHVPLRHARLHRRPARPAAEAARPAGDRLAHRVPPLPRQRPQGRPRGRRPAAPGADLAPPRPGRAARARRGAVPGVGARHAPTPNFLHVRYGVCAQPLSLELVPPESAPIDQVDPAAASALHRLLVVHRLQPNLPASASTCAPSTGSRCAARRSRPASLARAMICSATAFHSPEHLVVAVLTLGAEPRRTGTG